MTVKNKTTTARIRAQYFLEQSRGLAHIAAAFGCEAIANKRDGNADAAENSRRLSCDYEGMASCYLSMYRQATERIEETTKAAP